MRGQEELTGRPTQSEPEFADDAAVMLLLEAALRAGIDAPYSCIDGGCGVCRAKLLLGDVHVEQTDGLSASDVAEGWILTCQSRPATDVVHIAYDR
jgi:ferredoxin